MQGAGLLPPGGVLEYFEHLGQAGQRRRCTKEPLKIDKNRRGRPIWGARLFQAPRTENRDSNIETMITIATNNPPVSPAIHSRGFFSPAIHRASPRFCRRSTRNHFELNYAKQTQFAACSNERKYCANNGLSKYSTLPKPAKQTQFQYHHFSG